MTCSQCGAENPGGSKFCLNCGARLTLACSSCGALLPPGARFCNECGAPVAGPVPPAARVPSRRSAVEGGPVPVAERRLVSVLFVDLVGFTSLSESRDSEEVRELLSRYFETCRTIVDRYGGTVEKFIGDAVMAVWGTPVATEDDAERAVRAALDTVDAVSALAAEVGAPALRARGGVLTGEATVTLGATGEGMVAGDIVNTASRIQSAAEPGTVLAGGATRRATEAAIVYEDAGVRELKGKAEPVHVWRALRVSAGRGGLMKSEGLEAPFVGREREIKLVRELFHASLEEGRAHLVQVTGIAGIGKSRLAWEFFKYMDGLERVFLWHRGRCLAYGEGVTYWALAEMVRGRAGILEGEDRASAATKLRQAVERYVPSAEDRRFVEPRLAHLIGLEERTSPDKADLFAGWRLFFERLAASDPVVMVFEDLQWADPSLLEFIDHVLEWSRALPIFVIALARPDGRAALAGARRNSTSISLEPLGPDAMHELLRGLVPGLPDDIGRQILERSEGVPLYAVETVRMLLDRGVLVQEGSVYRPTGPIPGLDIPETLHALITARLDGLTSEERRLVQDAAVLGKTFSPRALAAVSGQPEAELAPTLASLVAKEMLSVQADPRSPELGQYGFLQDLARTVAYDTLAKRDRKARHLRVARYLEQAWGGDEEEIVEVAASHYLDAYRLAPEADDAAEIREHARRMLVRAAERAASLAAAKEGQRYYEQAAELTASSLERAELVEGAGHMAFLQGHPDEAIARFAEAARLFEETGQAHQAARVEARRADVEFFQGHLDRAVERTARAHQVLSGDEADPDLAVVTAQLGRFLALGGRGDEAAPVLEQALELAEQLELPEVYSQALSSRAIVLMGRGRLREATANLRDALEVALEHDFTAAAARAHMNLGVLFEMQDRFSEELGFVERALEFARRTGNRAVELGALTGSAAVLFTLGQWEDAFARFEEARKAEELSSMGWAATNLMLLVAPYVARGSLREAREVLDQLQEVKTSSGEERIFYLGVEAELLLAEGDPGAALASARQAVAEEPAFGLPHAAVKRALVRAVEASLQLGDLAGADDLLGIVRRARPGLVSPWLRAQAARLSALLAARRGDRSAVEPGFEAAERGLRDLSTPCDLAVVLVEHAEWLLGEDRGSDAGPLLAEASEIFARLGAGPLLERASRAARAAEAPAGVPES